VFQRQPWQKHYAECSQLVLQIFFVVEKRLKLFNQESMLTTNIILTLTSIVRTIVRRKCVNQVWAFQIHFCVLIVQYFVPVKTYLVHGKLILLHFKGSAVLTDIPLITAHMLKLKIAFLSRGNWFFLKKSFKSFYLSK